jgi:hypothetical protein
VAYAPSEPEERLTRFRRFLKGSHLVSFLRNLGGTRLCESRCSLKLSQSIWACRVVEPDLVKRRTRCHRWPHARESVSFAEEKPTGSELG